MVLDSVGIGALPDAHLFGDEGSNTLGNIAKHVSNFSLPNLSKIGLANIDAELHLPSVEYPVGAFGKAKQKSLGKDTTTGHWEICGVHLEKPFPVFPEGFPDEILTIIETETGVSFMANEAGSGTDIINKYGEKHLQSKNPILYTSADSVFQLAMHEEIFPIERQYEICKKARALLKGKFEVGRVIARPFIGDVGSFVRTSRRKDFSVKPPISTVLNALKDHGKEVLAIGKISDIFSGSGITKSIKTKNNQEGIQETIKAMKQEFEGLIFTNLIDFDMHYGHRRDVEGYAKCLMDYDQVLPEVIAALGDEDILIISADHGNDPTFKGTDHTREYIPVLVLGKKIKKGIHLGTRNTFSDIGATILDAFKIPMTIDANSFYDKVI